MSFAERTATHEQAHVQARRAFVPAQSLKIIIIITILIVVAAAVAVKAVLE